MGQPVKSAAKIFEFKPKDRIVYKFPSSPLRITQEDLAECEFLAQSARTATKALQEKRFMIRFGLEHGALVEPGLRSVRLEKRKRLRIA